MIPKIIHYCWFGGNPLPESAIKCIKSWKKFLPDYEIMEWNESNYDVHIAIMRNWLRKQEWIMNIPNYYMQYIAIVALTFAISFIVTYLISLLPFGDYIIGFKQKRK